MAKNKAFKEKQRIHQRYFGNQATYDDYFGDVRYKFNLSELLPQIEKYKKWYKINNPEDELLIPSDIPDEFLDFYKVHYGLSGENISRAKLVSKLTKQDIKKVFKELLIRRSTIIDIEKLTPEVIYNSNITKGRIQVDTGSFFEKKINNFLNEKFKNSDFDIRNGKKQITKIQDPNNPSALIEIGHTYDKDIFFQNRYVLSLEISFQVTTNSTMERKSNLDTANNKVIFVFGGAGWIDRYNALNRIDPEINQNSSYLGCFGPIDTELEALYNFIVNQI